MDSLRKPKKITIRGSDEREHSFMVKGGEDLRIDQRVEFVFTNMNKIMAEDKNSRNFSLRTYAVIPLNTRSV